MDNYSFVGSLQFPPGSSPLVSRMAIYYGPNIEQAFAPELPLSCYHGQLYLQKAEIIRGQCYTKGIKLSLLAGKIYLFFCVFFSFNIDIQSL